MYVWVFIECIRDKYQNTGCWSKELLGKDKTFIINIQLLQSLTKQHQRKKKRITLRKTKMNPKAHLA